MSDARFLYCVIEQGCEDAGPCKIGIATDVGHRLKTLQVGNHRPLTVAWSIAVPNPKRLRAVEARLLIQFRPNPYDEERVRLQSEWVNVGPLRVYEHATHHLQRKAA